MAGKKYYAVAKGRRRGIFTDWATTEQQVKGFAGARYKSFASRSGAQAWLENPVSGPAQKQNKQSTVKPRVVKVPDNAIHIYTDGGCRNNPGPGGYGIVICEGGRRREISGGFRLTTNNRMEMAASIVALAQVGQSKKAVTLFSDSNYLVQGINKGWARSWQANNWRKADKSKALNADLWHCLLELLSGLQVSFIWLKGHAGHELNECCDRLAVAASRKPSLPVDRGYEKKSFDCSWLLEPEKL